MYQFSEEFAMLRFPCGMCGAEAGERCNNPRTGREYMSGIHIDRRDAAARWRRTSASNMKEYQELRKQSESRKLKLRELFNMKRFYIVWLREFEQTEAEELAPRCTAASVAFYVHAKTLQDAIETAKEYLTSEVGSEVVPKYVLQEASREDT